MKKTRGFYLWAGVLTVIVGSGAIILDSSGNSAAEATVAPQSRSRNVQADPMKAVLDHLAQKQDFTIVQIGAYIGDTENDPLFPFLWEQLDANRPADRHSTARAILVEPIGEYFQQLCKNYEGTTNVFCEQVAIADRAGEMEMYRLAADPVAHGFPAWLSQLSSLKKERMEELWDGYERQAEAKQFYLENRITETVACVTLEQLLAKHTIDQVDLLQIDVEGYDYEIIKTIDFQRLKPRFINYERVLLQQQEPACRQLLEDQGYLLFDWGQDTLAVLVESA